MTSRRAIALPALPDRATSRVEKQVEERPLHGACVAHQGHRHVRHLHPKLGTPLAEPGLDVVGCRAQRDPCIE
jgi:hypothetical protein